MTSITLKSPLAAIALLLAASSSFAASTWSLPACSASQNLTASATCVVPGGAAGLAISGLSNATGTTTAPTTTNNATNFAAANIYDWGTTSGLGIVSSNESSGPSGPHAIDNGYGIDAMLLNFTAGPVNMTGLIIGYNSTDSNTTTDNNGSTNGGGTSVSYNDSDLSVFAWTGATGKTATTAFNPTSLMTTASGWTLVGNFANVGSLTDNKISSLGSSTYSSYWLVSAYSSAYGAGTNLDQGNDSFKLLAVAGQTCVGTVTDSKCVPPTTNKVPEPGSLALMGIAMMGFVAARRRTKNAA